MIYVHVVHIELVPFLLLELYIFSLYVIFLYMKLSSCLGFNRLKVGKFKPEGTCHA